MHLLSVWFLVSCLIGRRRLAGRGEINEPTSFVVSYNWFGWKSFFFLTQLVWSESRKFHFPFCKKTIFYVQLRVITSQAFADAYKDGLCHRKSNLNQIIRCVVSLPFRFSAITVVKSAIRTRCSMGIDSTLALRRLPCWANFVACLPKVHVWVYSRSSRIDWVVSKQQDSPNYLTSTYRRLLQMQGWERLEKRLVILQPGQVWKNYLVC